MAEFFDEVSRFDHIVITAGDGGGGERGFVPTGDLDLDGAPSMFAVRFWGAIAEVQYGARGAAPNGSITLTSGVLSAHPAKGPSMLTAVSEAVEAVVRCFAVDLPRSG